MCLMTVALDVLAYVCRAILLFVFVCIRIDPRPFRVVSSLQLLQNLFTAEPLVGRGEPIGYNREDGNRPKYNDGLQRR